MSAKLASYVKFYQNNKDFIDSLGKCWVLIGLVLYLFLWFFLGVFLFGCFLFCFFEGETGMRMDPSQLAEKYLF